VGGQERGSYPWGWGVILGLRPKTLTGVSGMFLTGSAVVKLNKVSGQRVGRVWKATKTPCTRAG